MLKQFVGLLAIVALTVGAQARGLHLETANNVSPMPSNFGDAIGIFTHAFRQVMPCGYPQWDIPVLAPYQNEYLPFHYETEYLNVSGTFSNLVVNGLNKWRLLGGHFDSIKNISYYDIIYPEIHILAENTLDVWAMFAGYPVTMAADGTLDVKFVDLRFVGNFGFGVNPSNPNGLIVTDYHVNFYLGDAIFSTWNNLWNIAGNNFVDKMLRESLLMWVQQIQPQTDAIHQELVVPIINKAIENITMEELIEFFTSSAEAWNAVNCQLNGDYFN